MPYKQGKKWRAVVRFQGHRYQALKDTEREAVEWEIDSRWQLKNLDERQRPGMDLMTFCRRYLDYAERYTEKVYKEKQGLTRRILHHWGPDTPVDEIDSGEVQVFLDLQARTRSVNASNKDRKNLLLNGPGEKNSSVSRATP